MKKYTYFSFFLFLFFVARFNNLIAQSGANKKETQEEYMRRMTNMVDSIKRAKEEKKNKGITSTNNGMPRKYSSDKYSTKKGAIENTYNQLTAAEKEKIKNFPAVPEAFRTDIDAQNFLNKLNGIDLNAPIAKKGGEKSMSLVGYCISYQSVKQRAEAIVRESVKLKSDFNKRNPGVNFGSGIGKTYVSENGLVYLPLGDASFVDEVVQAKYLSGNIEFPAENCIGTPDYAEGQKLEFNKGVYSLGSKGMVIIKFTNNALTDVSGPDLFVFEAGEIEPTNLEISQDGTSWIKVGTISGGTAAVDISKVAKAKEYYYYLRLTDLDTKSTIAGADIDAVAAIGSAMKLSLNAAVLFDIGKSELKTDGITAIKKLARELNTITTAQITIEGHTDDTGNDEANRKLSLQRAEAIGKIFKLELKNKTGFTYLETGKGESCPIVSNTTEENKKKNRRVEILILPK